MKIRDLNTHADRLACVALQELTWGAGFTERVPAAMLLVALKTGGVCAGAFDDDDTLMGFVFGVTGVREGKLIHWSDMLAVRPEARGLHLGEKLKAYQRDHCARIGVATIYWTFDPLVSRNAHLNLSRMGARVDEYVVSMYGDSTNSPLQGDIPTDRFVVAWAVDPKDAAPPVGELPADTVTVVRADSTFAPPPADASGNPGTSALVDAPHIGIRVPRDISSTAAANLPLARRWRDSTRSAFMHYLGIGYSVRGFVSDADGGTYLLSR